MLICFLFLLLFLFFLLVLFRFLFFFPFLFFLFRSASSSISFASFNFFENLGSFDGFFF